MCIYISISVFVIALAIHLYFLSLLIILIYAKTNLSYSKYLEANKGNINAPNSMDITADTQNNLNIHEYNQKPQYITANQISKNQMKTNNWSFKLVFSFFKMKNIYYPIKISFG